MSQTSSLAFPWLTARPIAHRGLHERSQGVIENSISAAKAALAAGYAIECDVRATLDGELVVFHDETLDRLTLGEGRVDARTGAELSRLSLCETADAIPLFGDLLAIIGGRTPLIVSIKSNFNGDARLVRRVAEIVAAYDGPLALKSFDANVVAALRAQRRELGISHIPLGMVAQARYEGLAWSNVAAAVISELAGFLHYPRTRPDFLSWNVADLPATAPLLCREGIGIPVTAWTVRSQAQADFAASWADQIIFEGFSPPIARAERRPIPDTARATLPAGGRSDRRR
ncbi:MAG: glycerophosphodiester phosphodiesterase [Methylocystis sp.]|nr:glycerophosphodiester phosphodiesterase [Methylocystis sp.]